MRSWASAMRHGAAFFFLVAAVAAGPPAPPPPIMPPAPAHPLFSIGDKGSRLLPGRAPLLPGSSYASAPPMGSATGVCLFVGCTPVPLTKKAVSSPNYNTRARRAPSCVASKATGAAGGAGCLKFPMATPATKMLPNQQAWSVSRARAQTSRAIATGIWGRPDADSNAVGDLNGDGLPDLLWSNAGTASPGDETVTFAINNGKGVFTESNAPNLVANGGMPRGSPDVLADLDNDGDLDLLVTESGAVKLYSNDGSGTFTATDVTSMFTVGGSVLAHTFSYADFNGDGKMDVLSAACGSSVVLFGSGAPGTFAVGGTKEVTPGCADCLPLVNTVADFDGDGDVDILVIKNKIDYPAFGGLYDTTGVTCNSGSTASGTFSLVYMYRNDGTGTFTSDAGLAYTHPTNGLAFLPHEVADLDGDGDLDIYYVYRTSSSGGKNFGGILVNDGAGFFSVATVTADVSSNPPNMWVKAADLDGDGDLDVLVHSGYSTYVLRNDGSLAFNVVDGLLSSEHNGPSARGELADFDGDGFIDWFNMGSSGSGFSERFIDAGSYVEVPNTPLNHGFKTGEFAFADVNGDSTLDVMMVTNSGPFLALNDGLGTFDPTPVNHSDLYSLDPKGDGTWITGGFYDGVLRSVQLGDLNQDGLPDMVIACDGVKNILLINKGGGAFRHVSDSQLNGGASTVTKQVLMADVNNDGALDVFFVNEGAASGSGPNQVHQMWINKNDGSGTFTLKPSALTEVVWVTSPSWASTVYKKVAFGDVNSDGILDALRGEAIFLGDGLGGFSQWTGAASPASALTTEEGLLIQLISDLNNDGKADLLQVTGFSGVVLLGDGATPTPTFTAVSNHGAETMSGQFTVAGDGNNDGLLDLYLPGEASFDFKTGNGDGTYTTFSGSAITPTAQVLVQNGAWADLDADGDMDYLLATDQGIKQFMFIHCASGVRFPSNSRACADCPTASVRASNSDQCRECPAHQQRGGTGKCAACAPGFDRDLGTYECKQCVPGSATAGSSKPCVLCAPGFYASANGSITCSVCMPGTYSSGYGSSGCLTAQKGFYAGTGATEQKPCAVGRYGAAEGRSDDQCTGQCADGHYCAPGSTTARPAACAIGFYLEYNGTEARCLKCDTTKMDCSIPGITLANMPIKAGGWRFGNSTSDIVACFNPDACPGNDGILTTLSLSGTNASNSSANTSASVRRRRLNTDPASIDTSGDALCAPGHTGMLCGACKANWYGYSDAKLCTECVGETISGGFIPLIILVLLVVLALVINAVRKSGLNVETIAEGGLKEAMTEKAQEKAEEIAAAAALNTATSPPKKTAVGLFLGLIARVQAFIASTKFKILVSLWQILQGMGGVFSIPFPPFYEEAVNSIGGFLQIEIKSLMPAECIVTTNYYSMLVFKCVWPICVYASLAAAAKVARGRGKDGLSDSLINFAFLVMFIVYPSLSTSLLSMFYCVDIEGAGSFLRIDLSLDCSTSLHATMLVFTFIMLGVHTIGTPVIYSYLFFWKHSAALEALKEQELADHHEAKLHEAMQYTTQKAVIDDAGKPKKPRIDAEDVLPGYMLKLTGGYEYRTYWFELFETIRKVLIVGVPSVFPDRGGTAQLFWGLLVCFSTFGAYMMYAPFVEDSDDMLSQLAQLQIFLTLLSSLSLRAVPPSEFVSNLVTFILFAVPLLGLALETPLLEVLGMATGSLKEKLGTLFPNLKPPPLAVAGAEDGQPSFTVVASEAKGDKPLDA